MSNIKTIFLLLGPKGSGKTYIGSLFEQEFNIPFIRVENWILDLKGKRSISNDDYIRDCFEKIESGIRSEMRSLHSLVFESTGLSEYFDLMLNKLQSEFSVIRIGIYASSEICLERVKTRDQSVHINVSDDQVNEINQAVLKKNIQTDFRINNSNKTVEQLKDEITEILRCLNT